MKRGLIPLITAGLLAGAGTAPAQIVEFDGEYVASGTVNFAAKPKYWTGGTSSPVYPGPSFSYAGIAADNTQVNRARLQHNNVADRIQLQEADDSFQNMLAFDFAPTNVGTLAVFGSTSAAGHDNSTMYFILHDSDGTNSVADGWYAAKIMDSEPINAFTIREKVADLNWQVFTPSTNASGTIPLATLGANVSLSTITNATYDQAGYYVDMVGDGSGNHNHFMYYFAAHVPTNILEHETLAYFDTTFTSPDFAVPELSGSLVGDGGKKTTINANDGTFGTIANPVAEVRSWGVATVDNNNKLTATLTLNNTSPKEVYLNDISFDTARAWEAAPNGFALTTSGDISSVTLTNVASISTMQSGIGGDADDFDVTLTNLLDNTLEPGGQAVFTWAYNVGSNPGNFSATFLDNVLIGGTVSPFYTAELQVNPSAVALQINADNQSADSDIDVSYIEGNPATNVNVSSVSIINDSSSGGFSVSPGTFVLNNPAPSNQLVNVVYDNAFGTGINVDESAQAEIQLIWNEVGSALVSTSTVPVSVTYFGVTEDNLLAVWHDNFNAGGTIPEISFTGVDAFMHEYTGWRAGNAGSTDGTYGTVASTNVVLSAGSAALNANGSVLVALTNNTGNILDLDSINFDVSALWDGPTNFSLSMAGNLGNSNLLVDAASPILDQIGNWADYDIELNGSLLDGEYVQFTFTWAGTGGSLGLDNLAIIGEGFAPAVLSRVSQYPWVSIGVSGLDTGGSEFVDLMFAAGDLNTNVVITGVSVSNTTHPGALSASGSFPVELLVPDVTNSAIFELEFDNTVANLPAGDYAEAVVSVEWTEAGGTTRFFEFYAYGTRPADIPTNGVVALFDTEFMTPDASVNGVLGRFAEGWGIQFHGSGKGQQFGSLDGTYGSLASPPASTNDTTAWRFQGADPVTVLTITNGTTAAIELSTFNFDIGRWYGEDNITGFTLGVSGDVTANPALYYSATIPELGWGVNVGYGEHAVDLAAALGDHTLGAGEVVIFTFTLDAIPESSESIGVWIDNVALLGTTDYYGGWAAVHSVGGMGGNPDGDAMDNLMEYATGGNPNVADSAADIWAAEEGSTNWLYHVHNQRQDDDSLTYDVGASSNLVWDIMHDHLVEEVGASAGPGTFRTVTNRTVIDISSKFIGLEVEQN